MAKDRFGKLHMPTDSDATIAMLIAGGFGVIWIIATVILGAPPIAIFLGALVSAFGLFVSTQMTGQAAIYEDARRRYYNERGKLMSRLRRNGKSDDA